MALRRSTRVATAAVAPHTTAIISTGAAAASPVVALTSSGNSANTLSLKYESRILSQASAHQIVAGVDEAGRGPLCGPVVAAAVALLRPCLEGPVLGVDDSKAIKSEEERERLYGELTTHADVVWGAGVVDHLEIDRINILQAAMKAMDLAIAELRTKLPKGRAVHYIFIDGNRVPNGIEADCNSGKLFGCEAVIGGDGKVYSIAAASIIAKVTRDRIMHEHHKQYPQYGFAQHKGYGTASHMSAIAQFGPCPIHRKTFAPMKHVLEAAASSSTSSSSAAAAAAASDDVVECDSRKKRAKR